LFRNDRLKKPRTKMKKAEKLGGIFMLGEKNLD
jgi:hypothetical protein